ncbi:GNAT family N-acetyltransferase [Deinococcus sp. QL22]|uniref:GNAT family N-acetyltransferase n=1 Tax=Deinococcus sp. QL22 TaxID=2939437 RepID=UPI002016BC52|nr:GNAT family protein [Deinococcus sp. QL22]UQN07494.1 GNAT family N-acetyltransferase [Deinococcus sp. QL22]
MQHALTLSDSKFNGGPLTLRPLMPADFPALMALTRATPDQWALMGSQPTEEAYFQAALDAPDALPFVLEVNGEVMGGTRLGALSQANRAAEIGWTFLSPALHGTGANRRMKLTLLTYAFEGLWDGLGCVRLQIRTDARNVRSQRAIEKLGAVREGVLRSDMITASGYVRDTVMYSITREEWPGVKAELGGGDVSSVESAGV